MTTPAHTGADPYDEACKHNASIQGLDPITAALTEAGIESELEQTGGFCMVVFVNLPRTPFYLWLTDANLYDGDGPNRVLIGIYHAETEDEPDDDAYRTVPLAEVAATVRQLMEEYS